MPAPAPEPVSVISTTSLPAGLQYRRTLYPPAPNSTASTRMMSRMNNRVPKRMNLLCDQFDPCFPCRELPLGRSFR